VHELRERLKIPAWPCCNLALAMSGAHAHLPHTFTTEKVVYTGTHDNDTLLGWWASGATDYEREQVAVYLGRCEDGVNWAMIRAASNSVASLCVVRCRMRSAWQRCAHEHPQPPRRNWPVRSPPNCSAHTMAQETAALAKSPTALPHPLPAVASSTTTKSG